MLKNSVFYKPIHRKESKAYRGYDYKGKILKNTMSEAMFNNGEFLYNFLMKIDDFVYNLIEGVKTIHVFNMIAVDKNDRSIN